MTSTDTEHVLKHTIPSTTISGPPAAWLSLALATQLLPNVGAKDEDGTKKNCTLVIPGQQPSWQIDIYAPKSGIIDHRF